MASGKRSKTFIPNNGRTMRTSDGHLQVARRDNLISACLLNSVIEDEQTITEIARDLKFSIHAIAEPVMILDFVHVQHVSSRMITTLLDMHRRVEERRGRLGLLRVQPALLDIFEVSRLHERLPIFDTFEQAVRACSNEP